MSNQPGSRLRCHTAGRGDDLQNTIPQDGGESEADSSRALTLAEDPTDDMGSLGSEPTWD